MTENSTTSRDGGSVEAQNGGLAAILFLLQREIENLKEDVDSSYELFTKAGVLTEFSKGIKDILDNPFGGVLAASENVDRQVRDLIHALVVSYFKYKAKKGIVLSAYRTKIPAGNSLHYSVVLNQDTSDSRQDLMEFFDVYFTLGIEQKFPVTFQFVPEHLLSKVNTSEKLV